MAQRAISLWCLITIGIRQNGVIPSQIKHGMNWRLQAPSCDTNVLLSTWAELEMIMWGGLSRTRGVTSSSKCSLKKSITIIFSGYGGGGGEREVDYGLRARTKRNVRWLQKETVVTAFHLWMSSGRWEACNTPPFSFRVCVRVCEAIPSLLLSLVKWSCPLNPITSPHCFTHISTPTSCSNFLLRCWFAVPKPPTHPPFILLQGRCAEPALLPEPEKV